MENNFEQYNPEDEIEDSLNNRNNINNLYNDNNNDLINQNILENVNYRKDENTDYSSLLNKYKILNMENFKNKNINIGNEDNNIKDNNQDNNRRNILSDQEMTKINNEYTKQINDIISKNFKNGLNWSQNIYNNSYINNNSNNSNYLELDRERKLLLLKNIELEKEINNLNNFVDIGYKTDYRRTNSNSKINSSSNARNSNNISNISYKNQIIKNKANSSISYSTIYKSKKEKEKDYKKEIIEAQNTLKILDNRINQLKKEININKSINNKYSDKIKEIKIWRETFYEEFYKYKNLLTDLKENLNNDKILYTNVIWKMKQRASDNINTIYENYKNQIAENEQKLDFLRKENEKLTKKENKVKEIYLYNFK